jgi:hypothetical protein
MTARVTAIQMATSIFRLHLELVVLVFQYDGTRALYGNCSGFNSRQTKLFFYKKIHQDLIRSIRPIGAVFRILAYCAKGRGFDSPTAQTLVYKNMSVCFGSVYFLCIICM